MLVGVAEEPKTVPSEVVGVTRKEKESLVNQLATKFDPPWSPEVVEVPLDDESEKVVLVIRINRDTVPAPIVLDGSILVRLDARNVHASRAMMAAMLTQATDTVVGPRLGHATRRPDTHRTPVPHGSGVQQPDLVLRTITSFQLRSNGRRSRLAAGMPGRITAALERTQLGPLINMLSLYLQGGQSSVITPWQIAGSTSSNVVLERSAHAGQAEQGGARLLCRIGTGVGSSGLEVCCDLVFWLDGTILPWSHVQQSFLEMVPAVANVLLPEAVSAVVGNVTLPPPVVEIHLSTHRLGEQDPPIENAIDITSIGAREDTRPFYDTGEILDETLMNGLDWAPAIFDAFTIMAMDWGYPSPVFPDQELSSPLR
ncbi:ATP-binding protein [Streptomyces monashensis]|uniref:ATP-binding protein n=1 Tax=Streptomyces monashensis TaxID=1678012 RepID=UPI0033CF8DAC